MSNVTSPKSSLVSRITEIAERVAQSQGLEIVEVELLGGGRARVLRIFIDKPEGVSHADCENVSQQVATILDVEDLIPGDRYTLEVSSPGVERKLVKPRDFQRFAGQTARIVLHEPIENQRNWEGVLAGVDGENVAVEAAAGKTVLIPLKAIRKANLKFQW